MSEQDDDKTQIQPVTKRMGRYVIQNIIGKGAMGVVYKAFDPEIERTVAIKTIRRDLIKSDMGQEMLSRFKREAKAAARCLHPNIVTIFEYVNDAPQPFLVMEFVEGQSLDKIIGQQHWREFDSSAKIVLQVLRALHFLHQNGIIHRDLKPANIMVLENGEVKVTDFGVAKIQNQDMTQVGMMIGTPTYMPPEQKQGGVVDQRSDLYTVGLILFEMLTAHRILSDNPQLKLYDIESRISDMTLRELFINALRTNPDSRFQAAENFIAAIHACVQDPSIVDVGRVAPLAGFQQFVDQQQILDPQCLAEIETELVKLLGPFGKSVLQKLAPHHQDMESLIDALRDYIPDLKEHQIFHKTVHTIMNKRATTYTQTNYYGGSKNLTSGMGNTAYNANRSLQDAGLNSASSFQQVQSNSYSGVGQSIDQIFSDEFVEGLTQKTLPYLGPICKMLINRLIDQSDSRTHLIEQLSMHIDNEKDRTLFLKESRS